MTKAQLSNDTMYFDFELNGKQVVKNGVVIKKNILTIIQNDTIKITDFIRKQNGDSTILKILFNNHEILLDIANSTPCKYSLDKDKLVISMKHFRIKGLLKAYRAYKICAPYHLQIWTKEQASITGVTLRAIYSKDCKPKYKNRFK